MSLMGKGHFHLLSKNPETFMGVSRMAGTMIIIDADAGFVGLRRKINGGTSLKSDWFDDRGLKS